MNRQERVRRYTRTRRRKPMLDVDLNVVPPMPYDSQGHVEASTSSRSQARQERNSTLSAPIDLDAYDDDDDDDDDDVTITSPRRFAVAKNNSGRNNGPTTVVDLDSEEVPYLAKCRRLSTSQMNRAVFINLDGSSNSMRNREQITFPLPPPQPKEPTFSCPVCMGPLVEEMSTKCGHIFCKACIKASITAQNKCPTCRRKISMKDVIRIYLPATNTA